MIQRAVLCGGSVAVRSEETSDMEEDLNTYQVRGWLFHLFAVS